MMTFNSYTSIKRAKVKLRIFNSKLDSNSLVTKEDWEQWLKEEPTLAAKYYIDYAECCQSRHCRNEYITIDDEKVVNRKYDLVIGTYAFLDLLNYFLSDKDNKEQSVTSLSEYIIYKLSEDIAFMLGKDEYSSVYHRYRLFKYPNIFKKIYGVTNNIRNTIQVHNNVKGIRLEVNRRNKQARHTDLAL